MAYGNSSLRSEPPPGFHRFIRSSHGASLGSLSSSHGFDDSASIFSPHMIHSGEGSPPFIMFGSSLTFFHGCILGMIVFVVVTSNSSSTLIPRIHHRSGVVSCFSSLRSLTVPPLGVIQRLVLSSISRI